MEHDKLQAIDNVLADAPISDLTRRKLLQRAAIGAAAVGVASLGPVGSALGAGTDDVDAVVNTAVTAEALAVTYVGGVVQNLGDTRPIKPFLPVLKNVLAQELDHYKALKSLGAKPVTEKFWAPDAFFDPKNVFGVLETADTLFTNAYLIGITVFTEAGKPDLARYAGEIAGTEAEHRALARFAQGKLPNNRGFEDYSITSMSGIVAALEKAGIGFGKKGAGPGKFYAYQEPPAKALGTVRNERPA
jgi:hypothetical protein